MATVLSRGLVLVEGEDLRVVTSKGTATGMVFRAFGMFMPDYSPPEARLPLLEWSHLDTGEGGDDDPEGGDGDLEEVLSGLTSSPFPQAGKHDLVVRLDELPSGVSLDAPLELETDTPGQAAIRWPAAVSFVLHRFSRSGTPHVLVGLRWRWEDVPGNGERAR